jgi:hypothetical protein
MLKTVLLLSNAIFVDLTTKFNVTDFDLLIFLCIKCWCFFLLP